MDRLLQDGVHCIPVKRQGWVKGSYDDVNGTIARLKARTGSDRAVNIAGRSCARIACWLSTGITLCNDVCLKSRKPTASSPIGRS